MTATADPSGFVYPPVTSQLLRSGCCLTSAGSLRQEPGEPYPGPGHPGEFDFSWERGRRLADFALVLISEGRGEWEGESRSPVGAGDALFLVPGGWHRYRPDPGRGWTEKWVCLRGFIPHSMVASGHLPRHNLCLREAETASLRARFDRLIARTLRTPEKNPASWGSRALTLMLEVFESRHPEEPKPPASETELALRFIRENAHRPITVPDVARAAGLDRRSLERRCRAAGLPAVGQCIMRERVERAEMLLRETRVQLKEIAFICGFENQQRMIHNFRRLRGRPPGALRHSNATASRGGRATTETAP